MIYRISKPALRLALPRLALFLILLAMAMPLQPAQAADRDKVQAFLNVTGFDVALDSIAFAAGAAPEMLGMDASVFGADWNRLTGDVFDTAIMRRLALDILEATLEDDILNHAVAFYASDLGQRLVVAENASHMVQDDAAKKTKGEQIIAGLVAKGSNRVELLKRMNRAIDSSGSSLRALQEIQIRFLLAASAAGVVELKIDADELRALIRSQEGRMRITLQQSALAGAAYTYQDFSDAEVEAYSAALEQDDMRQVYELLNAVQFEIMANRFEVLAARMADLHPGQDI